MQRHKDGPRVDKNKLSDSVKAVNAPTLFCRYQTIVIIKFNIPDGAAVAGLRRPEICLRSEKK